MLCVLIIKVLFQGFVYQTMYVMYGLGVRKNL